MAESIPGTWRYLAASVVGGSHVAQNLPCQDAHATLILDDGTLIVAVADGAGSAKRSQEGARRAVESSTQCLAKHLRAAEPVTAQDCEALLERAVINARAALQEIAPGEEFNEVATTLLLTIVTRLWLSTIQVGDGAVVSKHVSGSLRVLSELGHSEYINETTFLTSSDCLEHLHRATLPSQQVIGLAMLSDGMQLLALRYTDNTAHDPFFRPLFEFAGNPASTTAELEDFLRSDRVCERTDDDKTLILAVRHDTH
jgi:hypothetical protein